MACRADIREDAIRESGRPVSRIASDLMPYLRVLVDRFAPEQVILFGSYAYGDPDAHSDVDLLIVKPLRDSPVREATRIRQAFWPLRLSGRNLAFDLLVESPEGHASRLRENGAYYREINERGIRIV
jgi:predicted nucleotidyltransferase